MHKRTHTYICVNDLVHTLCTPPSVQTQPLSLSLSLSTPIRMERTFGLRSILYSTYTNPNGTDLWTEVNFICNTSDEGFTKI